MGYKICYFFMFDTLLLENWLPKLSLIVLLAIIWAAFSIIIMTLKIGISPMPSSPLSRRVMLDLLHEKKLDEKKLQELKEKWKGKLPNKASMVIIDPGCGWGGLLIASAQRFPESTLIGFERSPIPYRFSDCRMKMLKSHYIKVFNTDFTAEHTQDKWLSCNVVLCYLFPEGMQRLAKQLKKTQFSGIVISHTFALPGFAIDRVVRINDRYRSPVYRYVISAN